MSEERRPSIAVIGAGLMGHGIAQVFLVAGFEVSVWDPDQSTLSGVPARIADHLKLIGSDQAVSPRLSDSFESAVVDAKFVFEAAPEDLQLKRAIMSDLDRLAPNAIVATNTSVLRVTEIADGSRHPERIVGAHWWNPPYLIPLVEVVRGQQTAASTVTAIREVLEAVGKSTVLIERDSPGFVGNRMQFALWREAAAIVEEGICSAEGVDLVARQTFGRRLAAIGPLENADFIGLDLTGAIMSYLLPHLSTTQSTPRLIAEAVSLGRLGAKSGDGIFSWPSGARQEVERRLLEHLLACDG